MSSSSVNLEAYNTTATSTTSSRTTRARNKTHIQQQAQQQHGLNNYNNSNNSSHQYNASRQQTAHRGTSANVVSKRQVPHVKDQNVPNVRGSSYHRQQSQQQQQQQQHHGDVSAAATHSYNLRTRIRSSNNAPQYYPNRKNSDAVTGISENKAASLIAPQMSQIQQQQQVQPSAPPAPLAHYYQSYHLNNNQLPYYKDVNNNELIIERIEKKFEQQQQQEKQNDEPDSRTNQPIIVVSKSELNRLTENSISVLNATTSANTAANGVTGVNGALKRAYDYFDSTEDKESVKQEEDEDGEASSYGMIKKVCSADSGNMRIMRKAMDFFFALLREPNISSFLERDSCCLISDKYALAMVFTYFIRAGYHTAAHFTQMNFYIALYLASDIEEDIDEYKYEIFPWALGHKWRTKFSAFLRKRDEFLLRIGYRAIVSRKCCDEVMSIDPNNKVWKRERNEDHGGATRAYMVSRSRRIMSTRPGSGLAGSNVINIVEARTIETAGADEEINLPRGPEETARPCPLCFINKNHANVNFGKILSPQTPQVPPIQYLPTNAMSMTNSLLQTPVSIANHHKNPTNVTNNNSSNVQIAVNNSQDNTSQDDSTLCDKNGRASTHYIKFTTEKQVSDDDVIVLDASSSSISSTCSSKQQLPIKQDQVKQSTQATTTTTQQSRLKRTESKLVKTPKPSSSADIIVLDSKSLKEETDETATKTQQQPKPCGKELAPDTTERLPHTRQLSSAALHLSPSRHHSNLLTKLHTTTTTATNPTCDATYASSSSGVSTASSTMTSRSSSTSGYNHHHHHHRHHGQSTVLPAAPNNVAAPILMSKCPSLASVNSYYLHGDDTTVANTSDEYYYDDEEDDDEVDVDEDELDASDDDNEVFSAVNDAKANQQQQQQRLGHIQANKKHHHHHHNNASELLSSTTSSSRKHRHHSQGHKKRQLSNSAALLFTAAAALESTTTTTTTTATVKSKSKSKSAALNDQLVPRDILK